MPVQKTDDSTLCQFTRGWPFEGGRRINGTSPEFGNPGDVRVVLSCCRFLALREGDFASADSLRPLVLLANADLEVLTEEAL